MVCGLAWRCPASRWVQNASRDGARTPLPAPPPRAPAAAPAPGVDGAVGGTRNPRIRQDLRGGTAKAPGSPAEWKLAARGGARPGGAVAVEGTAGRPDAALQPAGPGAPDRICSADPVV